MVRYTIDDAYQWLAMYNDDMTIEEIHLEIGVPRVTIGKWLQKLPEYKPRGPKSKKTRVPVVDNSRPHGPKIHKVRLNPRKGHRRRGGKF